MSTTPTQTSFCWTCRQYHDPAAGHPNPPPRREQITWTDAFRIAFAIVAVQIGAGILAFLLLLQLSNAGF